MAKIFSKGAGGGSSGAPSDATYLTLSLNGTLTNERVLLGTADQIVLTDGGAGGNLTLSLPQSIATTSAVQFGSVQVGVVSTTTGQIKLAPAGSANLTIIQAGAAGTANTYTLPADNPAAGEFLKVTSYTAGSAVLEWAAGSSATTWTDIGDATGNAIISLATFNTDFSDSGTWTITSDDTVSNNKLVVAGLGSNPGQVAIGPDYISIEAHAAVRAARFDMQDGVNAAVSSASQGRLIYNATTQTFRMSQNAGAYSSVALASNNLSFFAATTSAELLGVISDETGTGLLVFATSPSLTTSLISASATFALLNTVATTVNAFGAATTLNIGASATCILNFGGSTTASEFRFLEPSGSGTNYSAFKAVAQAANITYSLPAAVGAAGTFLKDVAGDGVLSWATTGAGGADSWNTITAAVASSTTANGDNSIVFNTALTTNGRTAWTFGETTAAVGASNWIVEINTLAGSTAIPLQIAVRGSTVLQVSSTTNQIFFSDGSVSLPVVSFLSDTDTGLFRSGANQVALSTGGVANFISDANGIQVGGDGSGTNPCVTSRSSANQGLFFPSSGVLGISTSVENSRFIAGGLQHSYGATDAVSYTCNFRKSRGTVASPTVITTGDDLALIGGYGYVGATNTYLEAARILFDSTGTIADTTTGIGGIIRFFTRDVGGSLVDYFDILNTGALQVPTTITAVGTTGNQTINKVAGRVNIAAAGTSVTVTNSLVSANSIVLAVAATNDATAQVTSVVPAAGSFVINTVAVTAETAFNFFVIS